MKHFSTRARLLRILFLMVFLVVGAGRSWAIPLMTVWSPALRADPVIWKMRSKVQAQGLISMHFNDSRQMFYLINESYAANLEGFVAQNLIDRLEKDFENPRLIVLACYAAKKAADYGSRAFAGGGTPEARALVGRYSALTAFLDVGVLRQLKDPALTIMAIEVMSAEWYGHGGHNLKEWQSLVKQQEQAVSRAPRWAPVYYYNAELLRSYSSQIWRDDLLNPQREDLPPASERVLRRAKRNYEFAMRLDPGLKADCYTRLAYVYKNLGDPVEGLALLKEGQKLSRFPGGSTWQKQEVASFERQIKKS